MTLHGVPALVITLDTSTIISPLAHQLIILEADPLKIVTDIAIHAIVVALILVAPLMINMITENAIRSQLLVIARAKITMPNTKLIYIKITITFKVPFLRFSKP